MPRRVPPPLAWTLLALGAGACGGDPGAEPASGSDRPIRVVDAAGVEHVLTTPAGRLVSLVPSATLTLRALGADDLLVGRTDFDTAAWVASLPSVGGGLEPNLETLIALEPDLVIRFAGAQDPRTPARLDAVGIRHVAIRPDRIEDVRTTSLLLGRLTGRERAADSLVAHIDAEFDALRKSVEGRPTVRVVYVLGGTPPWVAGPGTYIDEVIELAGGVNVFGDLGTLYAAVSPEELASRPIDLILVPERAAFDAAHTTAPRVEEVGTLLELPGPDVARAARLVARLMHPGLPR